MTGKVKVLLTAFGVMVMAVLAVAQVPTLATIQLTRAVTADGKPLSAGTYTLRVSTDAVMTPVGQARESARWIEFVQDGVVKGRELASVVPSADAQHILRGTGPAPGAARVDLLKGGEYLRVWINHDGRHYLIHLVLAR